MIRRPPRSTHCISSAASDVYKRQGLKDPREKRDLKLVLDAANFGLSAKVSLPAPEAEAEAEAEATRAAAAAADDDGAAALTVASVTGSEEKTRRKAQTAS